MTVAAALVPEHLLRNDGVVRVDFGVFDAGERIGEAAYAERGPIEGRVGVRTIQRVVAVRNVLAHRLTRLRAHPPLEVPWQLALHPFLPDGLVAIRPLLLFGRGLLQRFVQDIAVWPNGLTGYAAFVQVKVEELAVGLGAPATIRVARIPWPIHRKESVLLGLA